ncbi:hypothetical protein NLG97_g6708 [Lecanicillium saksenae]|uniref:Uncharacterized protein n=1 Tax=Lecanicillium saksenae TaxID=468837 RepID=A0ACC1QS01_9HYPO|nr:hypothetical protein NLG97_g6708 [Lecanicillium saksenae]
MGGAVDKFFRHDATGQGRDNEPNGAKRLRLSTTPASKNAEVKEDIKAEFSDGVPDLKPSVFGASRTGDAGRGRESLPSPPPSPTKRDARQSHSKTRKFLNKFRSYSFQNAFGPEVDGVLGATGTRPSTRDIFKEKRRAASRHAPKRPGGSRLPMPVRFADHRDRPERPKISKPPTPVMDELPDLNKLTLGTEPKILTPAERRFADRFSPPPETFEYVPSFSKAFLEVSVDHDERIGAILDEKQPWALELNTAMEESIEAQRKTQVSDEDITRDYITNMQLYEVRPPCRPLLLSLSDELRKRTVYTIHASPDAVLAKAADSTPLHRHDFCRVIPKTQWLNDEIVNGVLSWLDQAVNHIGGVDDPKTQTRKCLVMTSFYYKQIKTACKNTQRTLKRKGVTKEDLLKVNTILLPICEHSHWTLMAISPSRKTVAHVDSLNPRGNKDVTDLALNWMKDALDDKFVASEWKTIKYDHPAQTNGYDCGVHTICNAICVAVGVNPFAAYESIQMPALRLQMSAVLVNGGFRGELDLLGF